MSVEDQLQDAANKATQASAQANVWAFGPENTTVPTDSGLVPTIAEFTRSNQELADDAINALGWVLSGDFTAGCTVTERNQYVLVVGGPGYRWDGSLPKVVPPNSSPTPIATGAWVLVGDASLRGDLTASGGASIIGTLDGGDVQGKLTGHVSVMESRFLGGAVGDGVTDDGPAIQAAMNYAESIGGGVVYIPVGEYAILTRLIPVSNVTLIGDGFEVSRLIVPAGVANKNAIILNTNPAFPASNFVIERLGFVGQWQAFQSEISDNGLITIKYVTNLIIRNCALLNSRGFAFNINECDNVTIEGNLLENACRDMIAVWGTPNVRVLNNILRHNDDDGISVSLVAPAMTPIKSKVIITGNILDDTGPIRTQATKNAVISNNVISRAKGQGIRVGVYASSTSSVSSNHGVLITNNVITDVIDRQWFVDGTQVGSINNRIYIDIQSNPTYAGTLPVAPGEINPSTGLVQSPYDYYYKVSDIGISGPMRAPNGVKVSGNICKRTLPAVAVYSDWGYGQAYTKNGSVNYQVPDLILRSIGVRVAVPFTNLIVDGNHIEVGRHGIMFILDASATLASGIAKNINITNNHIIDTDNFGIFWNIATLSHQDITITGNTLDCDPNFISANRTVGGGWTSGPVSPTAFKLDQLGSISLFRNNVRNCIFVISQTGVSTTQYIEGNILYADAASIGFSTSNKGIGNIPPIGGGEQWWIQYEESDPTSATYRQSLGANLKNASAMPLSGKWLTNMVVHSRAGVVTGAAGSQYTVIGWVRKTTGTNHVLNTDWIEMRCPTGT